MSNPNDKRPGLRMKTRVLAAVAFVAALFFTLDIQRSPVKPDEWNVGVTFELLNIVLYMIAALLFIVSRRFHDGRPAKG